MNKSDSSMDSSGPKGSTMVPGRFMAAREAKQKIEEARSSGARELDLSFEYDRPGSERLTKLPEALAQLTQLQSLDLSNNQLSVLPDWLAQLSQLRSLNLSRNRLTGLPEWLSQFTLLQSLNLWDNRLTALPESLGQLSHLHSLNLSCNRLTKLPESLGQLTRLQSLYLGDNELTEFPESLGQLTRLHTLSLQGNKLEALPQWLGKLTRLHTLSLQGNKLKALPQWLGQFTRLRCLSLAANQLTALPESLGHLTDLRELDLLGNQLTALPQSLGQLIQLRSLNLTANQLTMLPESLARLLRLEALLVSKNKLTAIPLSLGRLDCLSELYLDDNAFPPELAAAAAEGLDAVKHYLRAQEEAQVALNEAKLILIGEGEVGKTCLLGALRGDEWVEDRPTTHGIEIKPVNVTDLDNGTEITLNGWDFGGQPVYRPTHQLFFSAPAVYLVVWKPREGPQQGFVKEWIKLVLHRAPDAKILVVATHGGPNARQPDIDKQELWDLFGNDLLVGFHFVDSKPDAEGHCAGIAELKEAITRVAAGLPEMGRPVPKRWQEAREALKESGAAYLPLDRVLSICAEHAMNDDEARLFMPISHRLGHLIHYTHDPILRDIVILKPDWLATAVSFVLDDKKTRNNRGLVKFDRLIRLWKD